MTRPVAELPTASPRRSGGTAWDASCRPPTTSASRGGAARKPVDVRDPESVEVARRAGQHGPGILHPHGGDRGARRQSPGGRAGPMSALYAIGSGVGVMLLAVVALVSSAGAGAAAVDKRATIRQ